MRTLPTGLVGALIAVAITAFSPLHVHVGLQVMEGPERYAVAALGGAFCALAVRWALRVGRGP